MRSLARLSFAVLTALVLSVCFSATRTALAQTNGSSGIIISEFRLDGPNGSGDEFVEIVNNFGSPKIIVASGAPPKSILASDTFQSKGGFSGWLPRGIEKGNATKGGCEVTK